MIRVSDLRVQYPRSGHAAVDGMSFAVSQGEIFGFLGPNGAGKSTTQHVLTQLLTRYTGTVEVMGRTLAHWGASYREQIGVGFELPASYSKLTAAENLLAFASLYANPVTTPVALLDEVDLADKANDRVSTFSKGMQMRLNLARALVNNPKILFLDEPTSGLDPVQAEGVRALIRSKAQSGTTVFLTTHDMRTVDALCDRVAFVIDGRIAAVDTPRKFKLQHGRAEISVTTRANGRLTEQRFPLGGLADDAAFAAALATGEIETIHTGEASLDDVFAHITGARL